MPSGMVTSVTNPARSQTVSWLGALVGTDVLTAVEGVSVGSAVGESISGISDGVDKVESPFPALASCASTVWAAAVSTAFMLAVGKLHALNDKTIIARIIKICFLAILYLSLFLTV